jgi:hypothetical protein
VKGARGGICTEAERKNRGEGSGVSAPHRGVLGGPRARTAHGRAAAVAHGRRCAGERERKGASGGGWHVGWHVGWGPVGCGEGGYDRWPEPGKEKKEK